MKIANIAYAKNNLSRLLKRVQGGEVVVIQDRERPVARLTSMPMAGGNRAPLLNALARRGLVRLPDQPVSLKDLNRERLPPSRPGHRIVQAVLDERAEGR